MDSLRGALRLIVVATVVAAVYGNVGEDCSADLECTTLQCRTGALSNGGDISMPPDPESFVARSDDISSSCWNDAGRDAFDCYGSIQITHGSSTLNVDVSPGSRILEVDGFQFILFSEYTNNVWRVQFFPLVPGDTRTVRLRMYGNLGSDSGTIYDLRSTTYDGTTLNYLFSHDGRHNSGDPSGDPPIVHMIVPADFSPVSYTYFNGNDNPQSVYEGPLPATTYIALSYAVGATYNDPSLVLNALLGDLTPGSSGVCAINNLGERCELATDCTSASCSGSPGAPGVCESNTAGGTCVESNDCTTMSCSNVTCDFSEFSGICEVDEDCAASAFGELVCTGSRGAPGSCQWKVIGGAGDACEDEDDCWTESCSASICDVSSAGEPCFEGFDCTTGACEGAGSSVRSNGGMIGMPTDPRSITVNQDIFPYSSTGSYCWSDARNDAFDCYGYQQMTVDGVTEWVDQSLGTRDLSVNGLNFTVVSEITDNVWRVQYLPKVQHDDTRVNLFLGGNLGSDGSSRYTTDTVAFAGSAIPYLFTTDSGPYDPPVLHMVVPGRREDFASVDFSGTPSGSSDQVAIYANAVRLPITVYVAVSYFPGLSNHEPVAQALAADLVIGSDAGTCAQSEIGAACASHEDCVNGACSSGSCFDPCSQCSPDASCNSSGLNYSCTCLPGYIGDGEGPSGCSNVDECQVEALAAVCHHTASCEDTDGSYDCVCQEGYVGDGKECSSDSWGIRTVFDIPELDPSGARRRILGMTPAEVDKLKRDYARLVLGDPSLSPNSSVVRSLPLAYGQLHYGTSFLGVADSEASGQLTLIALFANATHAEMALDALDGVDASFWTLLGVVRTVAETPSLYRWSVDVGANQINPTGLSVDRVYFEPDCLQTGCWKVDVTYTAGVDNFNVFYIPRTDGDDGLSYDQSYSTVTTPWTISPEDTFLPANHPCTSADYEAAVDPTVTPASVTMCCIPQFLAMYRAVETFEDAFSAGLMSAITSNCGDGARSRGITRANIPVVAKRGQAVGGGVYARPVAPVVEGVSGDLFSTEEHGIFVEGRFEGLLSHINSTGVVDAFVGIYQATLTLDEKELRTMAGQLTGTVGVEHAVDTFVGFTEFSPTGTVIVDPFARQVAIHLEKTSFFTVSTHGTNDYTFLEYVNMRLVAVYNEDADFSSGSESGDRTVRTSADDQANYVQVTFTLGSQYAVDPAGSPLIPLDSVRAGHGTFFDGADLEQMCSQWDSNVFTSKTLFGSRLAQSCAPAASMCASPASIPDSFVVFNIPLGIDYFEDDAGGASANLANNVFVDMVISATEPGATREDDAAPNSGGDPTQMKTTLTASIPIVEGGVNIFCDGFTAKTDLKDVANADIVVGSASSAEELTRLRIKEDVASTQLAPETITEINSDSIEAGLMTLVLKGNATYFLSNSGRSEVTLELEDVVTIHIMEDDGDGADTAVSASVAALLSLGPDDNSLPSGLDTDGYALNGAFYFTIDRAAQRAHLEPLGDLLALCPMNPPRPDGSVGLETCVTRRDVRFRDYPWRVGGKSTAMEICTGAAPGSDITPGTCPSASGSASDEAKFMVTILGDNTYAKDLANDYAAVIASQYQLNGRYRRAYWINPGYEWTPTQTGGTPLFSVSQKLYLFALITLDEGLTPSNAGQGVPAVGPSLRRRMLLQSTTGEKLQDGESTLGAEAFQFESTPTSIMAKAFEVPEDRVATFGVRLQLTAAEACLEAPELQAALRATLEEYVAESASAVHTVQVTKLTVDRAGLSCSRRSQRSLLAELSEATAEVTMLVVFRAGAVSTIALEKIAAMPAVQAIRPLVVSPKVDTTAPVDFVAPASQAPSEDDSSSDSSNIGLIAGAAGGAAGAVGICFLGFLLFRRNKHPETLTAVQTINVEDLKSQLAEEV